MSINISSNKFVIQVKHATVFLFNLSWEHPVISVLLGSSGLLAVVFPRVFKSLVFSIPLLVSTVLFVAAVFGGGPRVPQSATEAAGERREDEDEHEEFQLKTFNVIGRQGEPRIAECEEKTRTAMVVAVRQEIEEQKLTANFEDTCEIKNGGMKPADFKVPEKQDATAENGNPGEAILVNETSSETSLHAFIQEEAEEVKESAPVDQPKYSAGLVAVAATEEEDNETPSEFSSAGAVKGGDDQQNPTQKYVEPTEINNADRNSVEFKIPEGQEPTADEEAITVYETSSSSPLDLFIRKVQEEKYLLPVEQPKLLSGLETEEDNDKQPQFSFHGKEDGEGDEFGIPPMNFFSMPLKSSWTRFDSSSDSISEASSFGSLGPLFGDLDPLLLTDEDDDPNASIQADGDEEDRPMVWREEEYGDENLFELFEADASDSTSEEDNLIEIELSEKQLLKRNEQERRQLQGWATEELNLIDLDYSDDKEQRLQNLMDFFSEKKGASSASALQEEENLIEIDLSAETLPVPVNGEVIQSDPAANKEKVSPILIPAGKEVLFLSEPLNQDYLYKTQPLKDACKLKNTPPFVPKTTADLIDLNFPSIKEMNMVGLEDEKPKPENVEATRDESITFFSTKEIQPNKITNLLD